MRTAPAPAGTMHTLRGGASTVCEPMAMLAAWSKVNTMHSCVLENGSTASGALASTHSTVKFWLRASQRLMPVSASAGCR